jgi:hypothetical protein
MPSPHIGMGLIVANLSALQVKVTCVRLFITQRECIYGLDIAEPNGSPIVCERREAIQGAVLGVVFSCLRGERKKRSFSRALGLLPQACRVAA